MDIARSGRERTCQNVPTSWAYRHIEVVVVGHPVAISVVSKHGTWRIWSQRRGHAHTRSQMHSNARSVTDALKCTVCVCVWGGGALTTRKAVQDRLFLRKRNPVLDDGVERRGDFLPGVRINCYFRMRHCTFTSLCPDSWLFLPKTKPVRLELRLQHR